MIVNSKINKKPLFLIKNILKKKKNEEDLTKKQILTSKFTNLKKI